MTPQRPHSPSQSPPAVDACGCEGQPTLEALQALVAEKSRLLMQREQDVQLLLRRVQDTNRWAELSAVTAAKIASCVSAESAVEAFAHALAADFGFEYAVVVWRGYSVEAPPLPSTRCRERANAVMDDSAASPYGFATVAYAGPLPEELVFGAACVVPAGQNAYDLPRMFVGRTNRTAVDTPRTADGLGKALERLATTVAQSFSAVRLNVQLAEERDSLQASVDGATSELRSALGAAECAWAEAVKAATARTEFLANMSHEIRTPMTAVLGYADLLDDPKLSAAERAQYLSVVRTSGRHLLQLIDDILDLARIESGRLALDPQPASILAVVADVIDMLKGRATQKGLVLTLIQRSPIPEQARIDAARLRQILINLAGNAVKFTSSGEVTISLTMNESVLCITVADTGIGIPADKLDVIFEAFEQSNASMSRTFGGSGLGLPISQRLAWLMEGDIYVESTLGVGSTFTLWLPIREVVVSEPAPAEAPPPVLVAAAPSTGRVLLVEDTLVSRVLLERFLTKSGFQVTTAVDGLDALEVMRRCSLDGHAFDVILLDMQMPNLDGYGCARQLRDDGVTIPIVALTAHAMTGDRERCYEAGCSDYLTKPVERAILVQKVQELIAATCTTVQTGGDMRNSERGQGFAAELST